MSQTYALVFLTNMGRTSIIPEICFEKSFKKDGKEIPLCEGAMRIACILRKSYECKILRLCSSKKYLESLFVTKEGNILLHGSIPPCKENLARKIKLFDDDTDKQKQEKHVLHSLNRAAEEQPPNISLDGASECNDGCANCCAKKLPPFPSLPDGFINTLVSLSDYFSHFHKSTAANILATGAALANLANHLSQPWQWPSEKKIELRKGAGVWIDAALLSRLVKLADFGANRKPPHQALVKSLLTHLMGMEKYIETSAEKMDRRLLSAVVAFTNEKYPETSQPVERYFRCINLNRGYLIKKRNDGSQGNNSAKETRREPFRGQRRPLEISSISSDSNLKKAKVLVGSAAEQGSPVSIANSDKSSTSAAISSMTNKKIIVVQRGTNPGNVTNPQPNEQTLSSVLNSVANSKSISSPNQQQYIIKTSATTSNMQPYVIKSNALGSNAQPYVIQSSATSSNSQPYIIKSFTSSSSPQPFVIRTSAMSSNSQSYAIKTSAPGFSTQPSIFRAITPGSNSQYSVIQTNSLNTSSQTVQSGLQSLLKSQNGQTSNSSPTPQRLVVSSLPKKSTNYANLQNTPPLGTDSNPIVLSGLSDTGISFASPVRPLTAICSGSSAPGLLSPGIIKPPLIDGNVNSQSLVTSMSQLGSFRFSTPAVQAITRSEVQTPEPLDVKIEKKCSFIEGALDFDI
ncbi:Histone-lysine N-methyltransferase PRDM9 [Frankliniella fusca]|uniref:Histone-lysine N-methyltransferase PRDM9 n=1 Tax=Frankliniella fusca TaxID=407009 RepID=A0AAE1L7V1_9NEOP|nr:Histone-lysine N-methyltransferase PRDM9 [Frankliniella fusca]